MELKDYWAAVVAGWKFIVVTLLVALLAGAAVAVVAPAPLPQFSSTREVFLVLPPSGASNPDAQGQSDASRTASYAALARGSVMADRVTESLGEADGEQAVVSTAAVPNTTVIELTVTHSDEDRAKELADAYVELLPDAINEVDGSQDAPPVTAKLISAADIQVSGSASGTLRIMLVAIMLGLGLGIGGALMRYAAAHRGPDHPEVHSDRGAS